MARRVFFSFHYQRDIFRVNQLRNIHNITGCAAAGFQDASLWEEAKTKGPATVKYLIDEGLRNTSVTVVCVGAQTSFRQYVRYEIEQSIARGNGIVAVQIHHLRDHRGSVDAPGALPASLLQYRYGCYKYTNHQELARWIEAAAVNAGR